ncbi:hypothetical protein KC343_g6462 [Hortaea werneckii]|uniref:BTB domain-containing protein n=1 Tax=Hortaea werneckii TaxID=91943 RepID=A0A3M7E9Y3_HORWE|nr:hypothetical protein KC352_g10902 [Hortaea werneckii]KAI7564135.1 hypothetical protein KC317_g7254 [Hortaea werneckii]KAI7621899.1 hypothetical protein KC346_g3457 [Hortaea werneckii]KAI7625951.1 hypothetical protein KC343_g6462 [Hortaea werneckii]KAI7678674.1 hypothetical protein KC319_g3199 [Hortaea werneckii]
MANNNDADDKLQHATLLNGLKRAFTSEEHSDLTIICQDRQWKAHKFLLCAQSEWFRKACAGPWKEGKEGTITLKEDDPQVIDALLHWLYNFEYDEYGLSQDHQCPMVLDVRVYAAADKYFVPNLKRLAVEKFEKHTKAGWKSDGFANAIPEAYVVVPESDRTLKNIIIDVASAHKAALFHPSKGSEVFKRLTAELPEFGKDLLVASNITWIEGEWVKYRCPGCGMDWAMPESKTDFTCPRYCIGKRNPSFWEAFKQE